MSTSRLLLMRIAAAVLLALGLAALGWLQYRWIGDVTRTYREELRADVEARAKTVADDIERELVRASETFRLLSTDMYDPQGVLAERIRTWNATAAFPSIARGVRFESPGNSTRYRPHEIRHQVRPKIGETEIQGTTVIPIDFIAIQREVLPTLIGRSFPSGNFDIVVFERSDGTRPWFASSREMHMLAYESLNDLQTSELLVDLFAPRGERPRYLSIRTLGSWYLIARHRSGSVDAVVASVRRRNVYLSAGILLILGVGTGVIVVSGARARKLAAMQLDFVAGVSHELRTPVTAIRSAAENLERGVVRDADAMQQYGKLIKDEARRLSTMVDQILMFAATASGPARFQRRESDIREIIESSVQNAGVEVTMNIASDLPRVHVDPAAISTCIQNLISNAVKYGRNEAAPQIQIDALKVEDEVFVQVSDRGPGIPAEDLPYIFDPFYRGRSVPSNISGSGLGLSIVKRVMEDHGGRVEVHSSPHGTTFELHLPIASSHDEQT